jgi:hypothetical protein
MANISDDPAPTPSVPVMSANESGEVVKFGDTAVAYPRSTEARAAQGGGVAKADARARRAANPPQRADSRPAEIDHRANVRFRIFIIDTGWNSPASKILRENLKMIGDINDDDEVYVLDRETSVALLRHYPKQVGRDPIITVHDTKAPHRHRIHHTHGFRLHLGILHNEKQILSALQMFARFLITHRNAKDLEAVVRKDLHRQGITGAIEIMGGHEHQKMVAE